MSVTIYATPEARDRAVHLALWIFLGSETLLFAGLFGLYAAYREGYGEAFTLASHHNNMWLGTINTVVLIVSSFFVAWAVQRLRDDRPKAAGRGLILVIALGLVFLGIKTIEYAGHLAEGIAPGAHYASAELPGPGPRMFFTLYYVMTGLHALHVIAGLAVMVWLRRQLGRGRLTSARPLPLELGGLYWHLVDIVWIFLWPLLYLAS